MTVLALADPEQTARDWARNDANISAKVGTKIFFSVPIAFAKAASASVTPYIVLTLVSQTFQQGDLGMQEPVIQFDCYGPTKAVAIGVALAVQTSARLLSFGQPITVGSAVIAWADSELMRWLPDPTINIPRYVVDVHFAIHGPQV